MLSFDKVKAAARQETEDSAYQDSVRAAMVWAKPKRSKGTCKDKLAVVALGSTSSGKTTTTSYALRNTTTDTPGVVLTQNEWPSTAYFKAIDGGIMREVSQRWATVRQHIWNEGFKGCKDLYGAFKSSQTRLKDTLFEELLRGGENVVLVDTGVSSMAPGKGWKALDSQISKLLSAGYKLSIVTINRDYDLVQKAGTRRGEAEGKKFSTLKFLGLFNTWEMAYEKARDVINTFSAELCRRNQHATLFIVDNNVFKRPPAAKIHSAVTTRDKGLARTITGAGAAFKACELRKVNVAFPTGGNTKRKRAEFTIHLEPESSSLTAAAL